MIAILVSAALAVAASTRDVIVDRVKMAIDQTRTQIAALPPARNDSETLVRLGRIDEAPRKVIMATDFSALPEAERDRTVKEISRLVDASDRSNQLELLRLLPASGWFRASQYGPSATTAAFQIVQHAGPELWKTVLPRLAPLVATGEVEGQYYGMMIDREAISEGHPQRFGTQFRCDGGKWRPYPIESPDGLEARRAELRFPVTYAEMKAHFAAGPPCLQTTSPPPPGMKLD